MYNNMQLDPNVVGKIPKDNQQLLVWIEFKNQLMTNFQSEFTKRHNWFKTKKDEIYKNLGNKCNVPQLFNVTPSTNEELISLAQQTMNNSLVVKEMHGHSSKEVKVYDFNTIENNLVLDLLTNEKHSLNDIITLLNNKPCVIEESLISSDRQIPKDFKIYCINGVAKMVGVFDRNHKKTKLTFYDIEKLEKISFDDMYYKRPHLWDEANALDSNDRVRLQLAAMEAERICNNFLNVKGILIRMDMYITGELNNPKVWLGEITARCGPLTGFWLHKRFIKKFYLNEERDEVLITPVTNTPSLIKKIVKKIKQLTLK